jgi:biotin carboxylase
LANKSFVLFICGGKWQLPWLTYLKNKGHKIALVDPFSTSVCVPHADIHLQLDARDVQGIISEVESMGLTIEFVTSDQTDVSATTVALLSAHFGTIGNSIESVKRFSNKAINREFVSEVGRQHLPDFCKVSSAEELLLFIQNNQSDVMLKPADAQSSRGIARLAKDSILEDCERAINEALQHTKLDYLLAESFVHGTEITVEGLMTPIGHYTLAISSKKHFRTGIASELRYPANLNSQIEKELIAFHNGLIQNTGFDFGITHAEYIVDKNEFFLIEMACRGGGSLIPSDIVPWVSGVNLYDALYKLQNGEIPVVQKKNKQGSALLYFFEFPAGEVVEIIGVDKAKNLPGVHRLELEFKVGDILKPAGDDRGRQGYCILFAESDQELNDRLESVLNSIHVQVNNLEVAV